MNYISHFRDWLLDIIFPMRCIECGRFNNDKFYGYMCDKCLGLIRLNRSFECIGCKKEVSLGKTCYFCRDSNHIDQLLVAADYNDFNVSRALKLVKYHFISDIIRPLSAIMKEYVQWLNSGRHLNIFVGKPIIVPIPLHGTRYNWRGFNQSELLAKLVAEDFQAEFSSELMARVRRSTPQAEITERDERLKNTSELFRVLNPDLVFGRTILLVDDVCTTGATLNEAARVLKLSGATKVIGLVVARG